MGSLVHLIAVALVVSACSSPDRFTLEVGGEGIVSVYADGELFARYHSRARPKPFLYPLLAPGGLPVTRSFPIETQSGETEDHPHHVSLWFAHGDVEGSDFWHGPARVETRLSTAFPGVRGTGLVYFGARVGC